MTDEGTVLSCFCATTEDDAPRGVPFVRSVARDLQSAVR